MNARDSDALDSGADGAALRRLRTLLYDEGGLIRSLLGDEHAGEAAVDEAAAHEAGAGDGGDHEGRRDGGRDAASPASLAAAGPRAAGRSEAYELLVDAIYEGYLLHYGAPRVLKVEEDDLRLLAGDRLYAIGLARLVELGDTEAVAELADTITLSALAQGTDSDELADAVWRAGARAVGWGSDDAHKRAKQLVLAGSPEAFEAMRTSPVLVTESP